MLHFVREEDFEGEIKIHSFTIADTDFGNMPGETINGTFFAKTLTNTIATSFSNLFVKLKLSFENNSFNKKLFSEGKVKDILIIIGCKAKLPNFNY